MIQTIQRLHSSFRPLTMTMLVALAWLGLIGMWTPPVVGDIVVPLAGLPLCIWHHEEAQVVYSLTTEGCIQSVRLGEEYFYGFYPGGAARLSRTYKKLFLIEASLFGLAAMAIQHQRKRSKTSQEPPSENGE